MSWLSDYLNGRSPAVRAQEEANARQLELERENLALQAEINQQEASGGISDVLGGDFSAATLKASALPLLLAGAGLAAVYYVANR